MKTKYRQLCFYILGMNNLKETQGTIPFTSVSKEYVKTNLTKEAKDRYTDNYKTLLKEII